MIYKRFGYNEKQATLRFAVKDLLDCLTKKQRYVLQAELFEDKDGTEIARLLHIKKSAVSRIRARAIRHLQKILMAGTQGVSCCAETVSDDRQALALFKAAGLAVPAYGEEEKRRLLDAWV